MTDRHYQVFNCVCNCLSFSKAADELFITQPAVSRYINDLEKHFHTTLFIRKKNGLILTPDGIILRNYTNTFLTNLNSLDITFRRSEDKIFFRIGAIPALAETILPKIILNIEKKYPQIQLFVTVESTDTLRTSLLNNEIDILLSDKPVNLPEIAEHPFFSSPLVALAAKKHPIPDSVTIRELAPYKLLMKEKTSANRHAVDTMLAGAGLLLKPKFESSSNSFLLSQCERGAGLLIISEALARHYQRHYHLKIVKISDSDIIRSFMISYHDYFGADPYFKIIFEQIKTEIGRYIVPRAPEEIPEEE